MRTAAGSKESAPLSRKTHLKDMKWQAQLLMVPLEAKGIGQSLGASAANGSARSQEASTVPPHSPQVCFSPCVH